MPQTEAQHTPKLFQRLTGTHEIIASLLLADLFGILLTTLFGALIGPPCWWLLRATLYQLHISLALDITIILILFSLFVGIASTGEKMPDGKIQEEKMADAWGGPVLFIGLIFLLSIIFHLIQAPFLNIPAPIIPAIALERFPWPIPFSTEGAVIAVALSLLAHLLVIRRSSTQAETGYSRAHPDGDFWQLIEQAYALYHRSLARFDPPPVVLQTPPTFLYFDADLPENPERAIYWQKDRLVISQRLLSPKAEQTDIFLPLLARLLHDHQPGTLNLQVEYLFLLARIADKHAFTRCLLAIPIQAAQSNERRWQRFENDRVLDRDRFAYWCGESKRLRKLLRQQLELRRQNNRPDNEVPTLTERIDHLNSLMRREVRQVRELQAALPVSEPPSEPLNEDQRETAQKKTTQPEE
ncbi:DUF2309 domain-containing protein [Dictyobacter arantiisoli]|uniref:Uncharacterized protein n=1 Tax=Dictyobacter arantiisoli TaxID=2014874 RepID=A0A5A5THQ9_9CHLR|nr:DUF2309 domain-containing protein [Dictyobacter arantiisoli]GCF10907.1 hypothetical protein KDI_44710 [Dictyobacter arantiisoli]